MTAIRHSDARVNSVESADGTPIGYRSLGAGPGLIVVVGGVLSSAASYRPLADRLAGTLEVHVVDRRGRPGSGPQRPGHSIEDECDDLFAVIGATGAGMVFGHSFGGLVALETARRRPGLESVFVYEPGVPLRGQFDLGWLDSYERLLERGDRRGAFACMVKHAGFAPGPGRNAALVHTSRVTARDPLAAMGDDGAAIESQSRRASDPSRARHAQPGAVFDDHGTHRPDGRDAKPRLHQPRVLTELAQVIPDAIVDILPELGHLAPEEQPEKIAAAILRHS